MLIDDERNVSCGGDPFNFLKSVMKGLYIQLDPGQDAEVLVTKEKYPYGKDIFSALASNAKLTLVDLVVNGKDFNIFVRKPMQ
ncbi:hypothetical protein B1B_05805 [mine drainage metagenome]|uniref:SirA family protein n=1 Tax=mine drainage metagenome TaxID=410659 RepID=T1CJC7_9ZZZZ